MIYEKIENISRLYKYVALLGDLKSRSADFSDITKVDADIFQEMGVNPGTVYSIDVVDHVKQYNLDSNRISLRCQGEWIG